MNKKEKEEYVWVCDYCGADFETERECDNHENLCRKNPKNKDNNNNFFWFYIIGAIIFIWIIASIDTNKTSRVTYTQEDYYDLEEEVEECKDALEEANDRIEEAKYYTWESYEDMGYALENLETVDDP